MKNRMLAAFLAVVMLLGMVPMVAAEQTSDNMDVLATIVDSTCSDDTWGEPQKQNGGKGAWDGNPDTIWHSDYGVGEWIDLKLEQPSTVAGIKYLPRQNHQNGRLRSCEIFVSTNGNEYTLAGAFGPWESDTSWKTCQFEKVYENVTHVKLVATDTNGDFAGAAELQVISKFEPYYSIFTSDVNNGAISVQSSAQADVDVSFTVTPDFGYLLTESSVQVHCGNQLISFKDIGNGSYTFTMPDGDVTISAAFEQKRIETSPGDIYVSPSRGSDVDGDGSKDNPYASLEAAQLSVMTKAATLTPDLHVYLREGTYYVTSPIVITPEACNAEHQIIYEPYQGEDVRILGGVPVTDWEKTGDTGIYRASVPGHTEAFSMFADGKRLQNAQETNWQTITVTDQSHLQAVHGGPREWYGEVLKVTQNGSSLTYEAGGPAVWSGGIWYLQGAREYIDEPGEWAIEDNYIYYKPLSGNEPENEIILAQTERIFYLKGTADNPVQNVVIQDLDIEMNSFGRNLLAHGGRDNYDEAGQMINGYEATREHPENMKGLVDLDNTQNVTVRDCVLKNAGYMAVVLNHHSQKNLVYGNDIADTGYAGIFLSGEDLGSLNHVNKNNTISNNRIYDVGKFVGNGAGIYLINSGDNQITHNNISNVPRYGISMKGTRYGVFSFQKQPDLSKVSFEDHFAYNMTTRNEIAYNTIYNTGARSGDGGGIESWGCGPYNQIHHNIIYNAYTGIPSTGWRGHSIFLDDGSHYTVVNNNIVYDEKGLDAAVNAGIMIKSIYNIVENNVFDVGYQRYGAADIEPYIEPCQQPSFRNNVVYNNTPGVLDGAGKWVETGDQNRAILRINDAANRVSAPILKAIANMDYNTYFSAANADQNIFDAKILLELKGTGVEWLSFEEWQTDPRNLNHYDAHSLYIDPLLVDPANRDYRLQANSPALALGTKSIATSTIGLNADFKFIEANDSVKTLFLTKAEDDGSRAAALGVSETLHLKATARTEDGYYLDQLEDVTYTSSAPNVATVSNGVVTAKSTGTATITASYQGLTDIFVVCVNPQPETLIVNDVNLVMMLPGQSIAPSALLNVTVETQDGYYIVPDAAQFTSDDTSVATVDAAGNVTAQAAGTAHVTVTTTVNGTSMSKTISVTVVDATAVDSVNPYENVDCGRTNIENKNYQVEKLNFGSKLPKRMTIWYEASKVQDNHVMEIRLDKPDGTLIGSFDPVSTGWGASNKAQVWIEIDPEVAAQMQGVHSIYFVNSNVEMNLNAFQFSDKEAGEVKLGLEVAGKEVVETPLLGTTEYVYEAYYLDDLDQRTPAEDVVWSLQSKDDAISLTDGKLTVGVPDATENHETPVALTATAGGFTDTLTVTVYDGIVTKLYHNDSDASISENTHPEWSDGAQLYVETGGYLGFQNVNCYNGIEAYVVYAGSSGNAKFRLSNNAENWIGESAATQNKSEERPETVETSISGATFSGTGPLYLGLTGSGAKVRWIEIYSPHDRSKNVSIDGVVTIDGTAKFGEVLTADLSGVTPAGATVTYQWYRDNEPISGASTGTYTLTAADIGHTISVKITGQGICEGTLTSAATAAVAKADGPAAPVGVTAEDCSDAANSNGKLLGVTTAMEYRQMPDGEWKAITGSTVENLVPGSYEVRMAATETQEASASVTVTVNAYNAPVNKDALAALYTAYKDKPNDNYTSQSWNAFKAALKMAEEVLSDQTATQTEVDRAKNALQAAIDGLTQNSSHHKPGGITPGNSTKPDHTDADFTDVKPTDWYAEAVEYVAKNGIMTGVAEGEFDPNGSVTRAMIWTVLARMDGVNTEGGSPWYAKAQSWAMETGVSDGTDPNGAVTREQLAAMLYRFKGSPAVTGDLSTYPDATSVSDWAVTSVVWATRTGLINGINGYLKPQEGASRAQLATMLMRFNED